MAWHLMQELKSDKGSPVDLAKSYMQSLPPWQSPLLGSRRFKSPPSGGVRINDEEGSKYFSSSKVIQNIGTTVFCQVTMELLEFAIMLSLVFEG